MTLLRREVGDVLRARRRAQGRTLRDVSARAAVSLGYLSEIERGEKEASSELLAAICAALGLSLSSMLIDVAGRIARDEQLAQPVTLPVSRLGGVADGSLVDAGVIDTALSDTAA